MNLNVLDWTTLVVYFSIVAGMGLFFARKKKDASQYFLAGRNAKWWAIGTTIFAANISSEHFIGLAGSGAASGLAVGAYEWMAVFCLFVLGWVFVPQYLKSKVYTMPEFLENRFSPACRWYFTTISVLAYVFTKVSVSLFAGAILLKAVGNWDYMTSAVVLVIATGVYTAAGGLKAVIYNDILHVIVLIAGSIVLVLIGLDKVGGFEGLRASVPADYFHMVKPANDAAYPWPGVIFGIFILGIWYWCTDQFIVQKSLAAKNLNHARGGIILTASLKILPMFLLVLPGVIAFAIWPQELKASPDQAYPFLITRLLPAGMAGLMIAALLGALISSLSAVFNSASTLITMDIYRKFNPNASDKKLVFMGRVSVGIIVAISILWIPIIRHMSNQIYQYLQSVQAYISAPIAAVFVMGMLWKRTSSKAAIITLVTGGIIGAVRFLLDIVVKTRGFDPGNFRWFCDIPFLNFCILMFFFCVLMLAVISLFTEKPDVEKIKHIVFNRSNMNEGAHPVWNVVNIIMSVLVGLTVVGLWVHFA